MIAQEQQLWSLVLQKYAGNLHILKHVDGGSLVHRARIENDVLEQLALDHFGLQEALENVKAFVEHRDNFPP